MKPIEQTPIGKDILKITSNVKSGVNHVKHKVILHTEKYDINIPLVESIEILSDFNSNTSDYIVASFLMGMGDFIKDIYPYRDNLNLTITRIIGKVKSTYTYRFVLLNNNGNISGTRYNQSSRDELNKLEQVRVIGQCVDRISETLRLQFVSGIYRDVTVEDMLKSMLLSNIRTAKSVLGNIKIQYHLVKPDNNKVYNHIKVPTGTNILQLPTYLQNNDYGVYNGNIGTYVKIHEKWNQDKYNTLNNIYVYPLYDSKIFDNSKRKLIIYGVSSAKFNHVENTYLQDGDVLSIIAGVGTTSYDDAENKLMDKGVGFTTSNPEALLTSNNITNDNSSYVDAESLNQTTLDKDRKDKLNTTQYIGPDANHFKYRSDIVKNTMMPYTIQWNFCDPDLIYPGMPVMFVFKDGEHGIVKLKGTVQSLYTLYTEGMNSVSALVNIMVEKPYYRR